jgi:hypothetical protein
MEYASNVDVRKRTLEGILNSYMSWGHSWFQHVLASNESKHPWMERDLQPMFQI